MSHPIAAVVVPTVGRPSLHRLLHALAGGVGPRPAEIIVVDDRRHGGPLAVPAAVRVLRSHGRGPAAARNVGWRFAQSPWVTFLDDDVVPSRDWLAALHDDLTDLPTGVAGSQGQIDVPLPAGRAPDDWERTTAGLADGWWITADMAYRRSVLSAAGGFDERFTRAFREDADLALRVLARAGRLVHGRRRTTHPVRPASWWISLRLQRGNADDMLIRRLHGTRWRARAHVPRGRRPAHLVTTGAGIAALVLCMLGRHHLAVANSATWALGTVGFAWQRIRPGPRTADEVLRMAVTSVTIPPAATWYTLRGLLQHRRAAPWRGVPDLVLFDRDGTLVADVPYNGDPSVVVAVPGARSALDRLRVAGVKVGMVTNQSGVARGLLTAADVTAVNARVAELLGPFDTVQVCPHGPEEGCGCRKPAPGLVTRACADVGVAPDRCVVVGDIGSDVGAARAAGATAVLVPTPATRVEEVEATALRCDTVTEAAGLLLRGVW
jgi:histidinol-phosphate phosphatase family protein